MFGTNAGNFGGGAASKRELPRNTTRPRPLLTELQEGLCSPFPT
jgi:hypothetical protein